MSTRFLSTGTTYLPFGFSDEAVRKFGIGDVTGVTEELAGGMSYERVGVDRAMAIAIDLAVRGMRSSATILDIGCSVGTIGYLLSQIGYRVTGIDSDVVAGVQDWQDKRILDSARGSNTGDNFSFIKTDLRDFLDSNDDRYDAALLLSVLHHWLAGYGYTGASTFDRNEVESTLVELCSRVRDCIYLEVPLDDEAIEMPPDPEGEFVFPRWFLDSRQATDVTLISSTVATNGKPRRLYRIGLR